MTRSTRRRPQRNAPAGSRRGATLVLVAMLIVVIGGMAAFAIDLARIYSGVNEMQTGADAAALAGSHRLQRVAGASPVAIVQSFASSNSAFGSSLSINGADIQGGIWNPTTSVFTPTGNWTSANAVRVTTRSRPTLAFGRLLNRGSLFATRSAVAWIANQSARDCVKPWVFDLVYVQSLLLQPLTNQPGVNALRTLLRTSAGQYQMTVVAGPDIFAPPGRVAPTNFLAMTSLSVRTKEYEPAIVGQNCDGHTDYTVGDDESIIPRQSGTLPDGVPAVTVQGVQLSGLPGVQTCAFKTPDDATCYDPTAIATAGVMVAAAGGVQVSPTAARISVLLEFRLMCVFRGDGTPGSSDPAESCPWLVAAGLPANNYVQGTIVGYPVPSVAVTGPGNGLGVAISGAQKLVLVK